MKKRSRKWLGPKGTYDAAVAKLPFLVMKDGVVLGGSTVEARARRTARVVGPGAEVVARDRPVEVARFATPAGTDVSVWVADWSRP